jgi:sugar lactone lactonase YvrE
MNNTPQTVGDFTLVWGESLRWDERRQRLYFVDCGTQQLHWLDDGEPPLHTLPMPSLPTGVVLTEDGRLVVALDDGLNLVDPDAGHLGLLAAYPPELGARANDATADLDGNIVTGTLNVAPGPGSYWWYSPSLGWRHLDEGTGNANGPAVLGGDDSASTLVFADTIAATIYAYDYDGALGRATNRRIFADTSEIGGSPDGSCADADGGVWSCVLTAGKLVRYTAEGPTHTIDATVELPSDVTFGGADLDRMFVVSIAVTLDEYQPILDGRAGRLLVFDGTGHRGRPEPRVHL